MNIVELIQTIATGGAVLLGVTYIVGGLIVNLNLTRRGLVEYQILKVKYLVVGIVFLFQAVGTFVFAGLPAFGLLLLSVLAYNPLLFQIVNVVSTLAAILLLVVWSRYSASAKSFVIQWEFWFIASTVGAIFPMLVFLRQMLLLNKSAFWDDAFWVVVSVQAVLTASLTFLAQIYHYAAFYYGRPRPNRVLDPIGIGLPTRVDLLCDQAVSSDLLELGLPIQKNIVRDIYLIDETDQHYIIALEQIPGLDSKNETYKIVKTYVKAILHKPENLKKLVSGDDGEKAAESHKTSTRVPY
jgi:hypothetical protein